MHLLEARFLVPPDILSESAFAWTGYVKEKYVLSGKKYYIRLTEATSPAGDVAYSVELRRFSSSSRYSSKTNIFRIKPKLFKIIWNRSKRSFIKKTKRIYTTKNLVLDVEVHAGTITMSTLSIRGISLEHFDETPSEVAVMAIDITGVESFYVENVANA